MSAVKFYDHAKNHASAAVASAVARVRREVLEAGDAYKVVANWHGESPFYWNGGRYDVLSLAKQLKFNNAENVVMTNPDGSVVDVASARY